MSRTPKIYSAEEILVTINKLWANTKDIQVLGSVSEHKARIIKKNIIEEFVNKGITLPNNLVPMDKVIKHLGINIVYLQKLSK